MVFRLAASDEFDGLWQTVFSPVQRDLAAKAPAAWQIGLALDDDGGFLGGQAFLLGGMGFGILWGEGTAVGVCGQGTPQPDVGSMPDWYRPLLLWLLDQYVVPGTVAGAQMTEDNVHAQWLLEEFWGYKRGPDHGNGVVTFTLDYEGHLDRGWVTPKG